MFCTNCGKELDNNARFCPHCGAVAGANTPQYTPTQFTPASGPTYAPSGNYGNTGNPNFSPNPQRAGLSTLSKVLISVAAVALVAVLAVGLFVIGVFGSDKSKVSRAAAKTMSAFADAAKDAGMPDLKDLVEGQKFSQSGEIALEDIDLSWYGYFFDASALEGIGVRFSTNYDLSGEKLSASATPFYGSADLLTAELVMDGSRIYVNSPELTGATYYGLDTATLGRDLRELGASEDVVGNLSFNIFQLVKDMQEITEMSSADQKAIEDACKELYKAIEVKKTGTETVNVNGGSVKCTAYTVVIPKAAMTDFLRAVRSAVSDSVDYRKDLIELFSSMGLPDRVMAEIEYELSEADLRQSVRTTFNSLENVVDALGDMEFQVYVSGGYIMAVTYSNRIEGTVVKVALYLGGGKNFVDDLSVSVRADDGYSEVGLVLASHGDHSAKSGTFTDDTVLEITQYGYSTEVSSKISYAPKKDQNNFSWRIGFEGGRIDMEGRLATGKNSMELHLEKLEFRVSDVSVALRVDYSIGSYQSIPPVTSPVMILTLGEDELMGIVNEIRDNAIYWVLDLIDEIPALEYFF